MKRLIIVGALVLVAGCGQTSTAGDPDPSPTLPTVEQTTTSTTVKGK